MQLASQSSERMPKTLNHNGDANGDAKQVTGDGAHFKKSNV